jgi:hypothetical protein
MPTLLEGQIQRNSLLHFQELLNADISRLHGDISHVLANALVEIDE